MSADSREIAIERGGVDDVVALRELWLELHHHHAQVASQSGEFVDDESSWRVRSSSYREWLADRRSFLASLPPGPRFGKRWGRLALPTRRDAGTHGISGRRPPVPPLRKLIDPYTSQTMS
jgi:hypothetical protein